MCVYDTAIPTSRHVLKGGRQQPEQREESSHVLREECSQCSNCWHIPGQAVSTALQSRRKSSVCTYITRNYGQGTMSATANCNYILAGKTVTACSKQEPIWQRGCMQTCQAFLVEWENPFLQSQYIGKLHVSRYCTCTPNQTHSLLGTTFNQ